MDPPDRDEAFFADTAQRMVSRPGTREVLEHIVLWRDSFLSALPAVLSMEDRDGMLTIIDSRRCAVESRARLTGLTRAVYLACDNAPKPDRVATAVRGDFGIDATDAEVDSVLADLDRRRLVLHIDGRVLALAVRHPAPPVPSWRDFPGGQVRPTVEAAAGHV